MGAAIGSAGATDAPFASSQGGATGKVDPVTMVRGTLIAASLMAIKSRGRFDGYLAHLPAEFHQPVLECVPGTWLNVPIAIAHYRAANAIGLPSEEILQIGRGVAARTQDSLLGTLVRAAKGAGVTPWIGLEHVPKLFARVFIGGSITIYKLGPKDARYEAYGLGELGENSYFRTSHRGMFLGSAELFCKKIYVQDLSASAPKGTLVFRLAWA